MAFVYEKLTEQDKGFLASFKLPHPLDHFSLATPRNWAVDRERGLFFISVGGQGFRFSEEFPPSFYYLIWEGQLIRMQAYYNEIGNMQEKRKVIYKVHRILAPNILRDKSELVIETIKEAITEYERGSNKFFGSIEFVEMGKPFFMEGDVRYE
jgi:hypothetical protein